MTITTIIITDPANPIEIQAWFDAHPDIEIQRMLLNGNIVYIIY